MDTFDLEVMFGILALIANTYLGVLVFLRNTKSWTNRLFFLLSLLISAYIVTNFISLHPELIYSTDQLLWIRIVMFVCSFIGPTLIFLAHTFPHDEFKMKKRYVAPVVILMLGSALLSLLPFVFTDLQYINGEPVPTPGPGIVVFMLDFLGLFIASFIVLGVKLRRTELREHAQLRTFFYGVLLSFSLMGVSTVVSVVIFKTSSFVFLGPIYTVILMAAIAFAIIKYSLFNIKAIATQAFVTILSIVFLARIFVSQNIGNRFIDIIVFLATGFFGMLLIKSVKDEMRSREEIHELAEQLTETNRELQKTNEQLRLMDQRKSEFVSIASHQLRSPLTVIKGYVSMILEGSYGKIGEKTREPLERVFQSSEHLIRIIEDFLNISKIEQGRMNYEFTTLEMKEFLKGIIEEMRPRVNEKGLAFFWETDGNDSYNVTADQGKVRQIMLNIIDNAIKYTPAGEISVRLEKDEEKGVVRTIIKDTGIGLSAETISNLFQKFSRAEGVKKLYTEGSGLGLYVASQMIQAHRGRMWVESDGERKGSRFYFELLTEDAAPEDIRKVTRKTNRKVTVSSKDTPLAK